MLLALGQRPASAGVSPEAAEALARKIARIEQSATEPGREAGASLVRVSDVEMESFVLYWMTEDIPPRVDSIDVVLGHGTIGAVTELTFDEENQTGNAIVDRLFAGTHSLVVSGALEGGEGRGRFELQEVRLDGIPVPLFVIDILIERFVNPTYPAVDLDEPFALPWGVDAIRLSDDGAEIRY